MLSLFLVEQWSGAVTSWSLCWLPGNFTVMTKLQVTVLGLHSARNSYIVHQTISLPPPPPLSSSLSLLPSLLIPVTNNILTATMCPSSRQEKP